MDAVSDKRNKEVTLMKSAQVGGTEVILNIIGYHIDQDPCPLLAVQPTIEMGESFAKDRIDPMIRDTPALRGKVRKNKSGGEQSTMRHKKFPGGHLTIAGANSPASLASRPVRKVLFDETDRFPPSAGKEGDPISLGRKRTNNFFNRQAIYVSTPTLAGTSRIDRLFKQGDQRYYMVPCPECGHRHRLVWANLRWYDNDPSTAHMVCPDCGSFIYEKDKYKMLLAGEWRATQPFRGHASFHISELYSVWRTWAEVVEDFLVAKKDPETHKVWTNTVLGECWEEDGEELDVNELIERREDYEGVPDGVAVLTAGVDVQGDRLEIEVCGFGADYETWGIEHHVLWGDPSRPAIWEQLDDYLKDSRWPDSRGTLHRIRAVAIDSGGHHTQMVYRFCESRFHRRIIAIKGQGGPGLPLLGRPGKRGRRKCRLYPVGVDTAKDLIFARLKILEPGPGYMHWPTNPLAGYDEEYFDQLCAERVVKRYRFGVPYRVYEKKTESARNEALDLRVYAMAALELLGLKNETIAKMLRRAQKKVDQQRAREADSSEVVPAPEDLRTEEQDEEVLDLTGRRVRPPRKKRRRSGYISGVRG